MKLSTKSRYAVTAMMELALNHDAGPVPLVEIAQRQRVSLSYLEQIFARLRSAGLVRGQRGPGGGFRLARPPEAISVGEIVAAVEDPDNAHQQLHGVSGQLWGLLSQEIFSFLSGITLARFAQSPELGKLLEQESPSQGPSDRTVA